MLSNIARASRMLVMSNFHMDSTLLLPVYRFICACECECLRADDRNHTQTHTHTRTDRKSAHFASIAVPPNTKFISFYPIRLSLRKIPLQPSVHKPTIWHVQQQQSNISTHNEIISHMQRTRMTVLCCVCDCVSVVCSQMPICVRSGEQVQHENVFCANGCLCRHCCAIYIHTLNTSTKNCAYRMRIGREQCICGQQTLSAATQLIWMYWFLWVCECVYGVWCVPACAHYEFNMKQTKWKIYSPSHC